MILPDKDMEQEGKGSKCLLLHVNDLKKKHIFETL